MSNTKFFIACLLTILMFLSVGRQFIPDDCFLNHKEKVMEISYEENYIVNRFNGILIASQELSMLVKKENGIDSTSDFGQ